jgi:hypothetical protein
MSIGVSCLVDSISQTNHRRFLAFTGMIVAKFSGAFISNCGIRLHRSRVSGELGAVPARHTKKGTVYRLQLPGISRRSRRNTFRCNRYPAYLENRMNNSDGRWKIYAANRMMPLRTFSRSTYLNVGSIRPKSPFFRR